MVSAEKTRTCPSCHKTLPISAFQLNDGRLFSRCLDCLYDEAGGDASGGGGFQLDIIDKIAAIDRQLQLDKEAAAKSFDDAEDRIEQQLEDQQKQEKAHDQQPEKKQQNNYRSLLFNGAESAGVKAAATNLKSTDAQSKTQQKNQVNSKDSNKQKRSNSNQQENKQSKSSESKITDTSYQKNSLFNNKSTTNSTNSSTQKNSNNHTESAQNSLKSNEKAMNTRLFSPLTEAAIDAAKTDSDVARFIHSFKSR